MTQETFKAWWYTEGSQAPYTHHDCEEHTMRMCEIAWANGAYKEREALAQPEQEPVAWGVFEGNLHDMFFTQSEAQEMAKLKGTHAEVRPFYTTPPQRTWVGLTLTQVKLLGEGVQEEAIKSGHSRDWVFYTHINEALKEKNT